MSAAKKARSHVEAKPVQAKYTVAADMEDALENLVADTDTIEFPIFCLASAVKAGGISPKLALREAYNKLRCRNIQELIWVVRRMLTEIDAPAELIEILGQVATLEEQRRDAIETFVETYNDALWLPFLLGGDLLEPGHRSLSMRLLCLSEANEVNTAEMRKFYGLPDSVCADANGAGGLINEITYELRETAEAAQKQWDAFIA